jgi:hypothetical protein
MSYEYTPGDFDKKPRWKPDYHNIGYVTSPYPKKIGQGDWGPVQSRYDAQTGIYQTPINPVYPYPLSGAGLFKYHKNKPYWEMFPSYI